MAAGDSAAQRKIEVALARRGLSSLSPDVAAKVLPVCHRGVAYWAHPVASFTAEQVLDENLDSVCRVLEDAGLEFVVLPPQTNRRRVVAVAEESRRAALGALVSELGPEAAYGCVLFEQEVGLPRPLATAGTRRDLSGIRVFTFVADSSGNFLSGSRLGCDVQFWPASSAHINANHESFAPGTLLAPTLRNAWTEVLPVEAARGSHESPPGTASSGPPPVSFPHVFEMQQPIDVVYTWVDGADPDWLNRKNSLLSGTGRPATHPLSANDSRYLSRDELRYSLRSLEMHANWARRIYLVTDRQVPGWLRTDHPRLRIVDHTELFAGRGRLPTFNSHAIETQLHHIDGLSEHFLYLNDDVFFGAAVTPEAFFHSNGSAKFFLSHAKIGVGESRPSDAPVVSAAKNNRRLLEQSFGVEITNRLQHAPHALRRSVLAEIEQRYTAEVCRTAHNQFRCPSDISMVASLAHYYGYLTGRAAPGKLRYFYADIARRETPLRLDTLLRERDADAFCLNDIDSSANDDAALLAMVRHFLDSYFPLPSSFEKAGS